MKHSHFLSIMIATILCCATHTSVGLGQSSDKVNVLSLVITDMTTLVPGGSYYATTIYQSDAFGPVECSADLFKRFLAYLVSSYPQVDRFSRAPDWSTLAVGGDIGLDEGRFDARIWCGFASLQGIQQDTDRDRARGFTVILTRWKPILKDPLAVHTASGQAPSKASAVNAARDLATSGYGNTIRKWGDSNCTQGTKLASQYGTARVIQWTCNIEFQTAATDPDGVARNAGGKGDTEDGAIANAKSLATAGLLPSQIKSWDDPICSTQQEHASRYNSTQMKTVWVCAIGYTTTSN